MADYIGTFSAGAKVYYKFNTQDTDLAPITLASGTIRVYKDDSTTEDDSGITLTADFDSRTGMHHVTVDTSTDSTFYAAGSDFFICLTVGTVDAISAVGKVLAQFTLTT